MVMDRNLLLLELNWLLIAMMDVISEEVVMYSPYSMLKNNSVVEGEARLYFLDLMVLLV